MAVVITKATAISNRDSSPKVLSNSRIARGDIRECVGLVTAASGDSIGSTYIFGSVPSNARISQVLLSCDGAATTGAADIGVYQTTENGSAVVDADAFASAQALTSALSNSDVTHESGVYGIEDSEKPLWEVLGLSEDPKISYDIVATLTAAMDAADDIALKVRYAE